MRMLKIEWKPQGECKDRTHETCDCSMVVILPEELDSMAVHSSRYEGTVRQSKQDILMYAMAVIAANFDYSTTFVPVARNIQSVLTTLRISAGAYQNITRVAPHFHTQNTTRPTELPTPVPEVQKVFEMADILYFARRSGGYNKRSLEEKIWRVADGQAWPQEDEIPSLAVLAARRASPWNQAVGGNATDKPYTRSALADLHSSKFSKQTAIYGRNVKYLNEFARSLAPLMSKALDCLYRILGTKEYIGKFDFEPDPKYITSIYLGASSGDAPGPELQTHTKTGIPIYVSPRGKKIRRTRAGSEKSESNVG